MKTLSLILAGAALALDRHDRRAGQERRGERSEARAHARGPHRRRTGQLHLGAPQRPHRGDRARRDRLRRGRTIYVARPPTRICSGRNDIVVIERFGGQLCTNDVIRTVDRYQGFTTGAVFLDNFVPYTKGRLTLWPPATALGGRADFTSGSTRCDRATGSRPIRASTRRFGAASPRARQPQRRASAGVLTDPRTALAAVLLFDQLPRNLTAARRGVRDRSAARALAYGALRRGWDVRLTPQQAPSPCDAADA
jgi:hypothetical protein